MVCRSSAHQIKLAAAALILSLSAQADFYTARVVAVHDGDTLTALDGTRVQHKIRLAGIDAPERGQPFGQRSRLHLADQVFDRGVTLDCGKVDRYQREICVVRLDRRDINLEQVTAGYAMWYRHYAREQSPAQRRDYAEAEDLAREAHKGLWAEDNPTPPWEWRHRKRQ